MTIAAELSRNKGSRPGIVSALLKSRSSVSPMIEQPQIKVVRASTSPEVKDCDCWPFVHDDDGHTISSGDEENLLAVLKGPKQQATEESSEGSSDGGDVPDGDDKAVKRSTLTPDDTTTNQPEKDSDDSETEIVEPVSPESVRISEDTVPHADTQSEKDLSGGVRRKSILKVSDATNSTTQSSSSLKVSFDTIHVRHYSMGIGDNPSCTIGAPISLTWDFEEDDPVDVDNYEFCRRQRRKLRYLVLSFYRRQDILRAAGFSDRDLAAADQERQRAQRQRQSTRMLLPACKFEEAWQSAGRKFQRACCGKSNEAVALQPLVETQRPSEAGQRDSHAQG